MALTDRRVAQVLLQFQQSRGEIAQARRNIEFLKEGYEELESAAKDADASLSRQSSRLAAIASVTRSEAIPAVDDLRASIEGLSDAQDKAAASGGFGGIQRLGRLAANVPGLESLSGGFNVADDIGDAVQALTALSPAALGVVGVVGAVGAGFAALELSLQGSKKELDAATAANQFYYSEVRRLTTEQAQQRLDDIHQQLEDQRAELANIEQAFGSGFQAAADQFGEAGARVLFGLGQLSSADDTLTKRADELRASITELEGQEGALNRARQDGTTATNDAAQAELDLLDARAQSALRGGQTVAQEAQARQQIEDAATTQELDRLRAAAQNRKEIIDTEIAFLQPQFQDLLSQYNALRASGTATPQQLQDAAVAVGQVQSRLIELGHQSSELTSVEIPLINSRYDQVRAAQDLADKEKNLAAARQEAAKNATRGLIEIRKLEAAMGESQAKMEAAITKIRDDLTAKEIEAERDRDQAITDAEMDANDARKEAARKAAQDREKLEEDHQKALLKITRDFNRSSALAIQNRDAVALDAAKSARDEATQDENDSYDERKRAIDKQLRETNRQIDKRLVEQRNLAVARYNEQLRAAYDAANKARNLEVQRYNAELQINQQRLAALQAQQQAYNSLILGTAKAGADQLLATERYLWQQRNLIASGTSGLASGKPIGGGNTPPPTFPPKFQSGGYITRGGLAVVHPKEVILNERQQRGMGGINIAINGMGMTERQIEDKVIATLRQGFREVRKSA